MIKITTMCSGQRDHDRTFAIESLTRSVSHARTVAIAPLRLIETLRFNVEAGIRSFTTQRGPARGTRLSKPGRAVRWVLVLCAIPMLLTRMETRVSAQGRSAESSSGPSPAEIEFFEKRVRPILVEHCYECHDSQADGGLSLSSRRGLLNGGDSGPALVVGDPDSSLLIEAVRYQNRDFQMPPQNRLDADSVSTLETWVAMGAPDPRTASETTRAPTGMSIEDGRDFWSFQPVGDPVVPTVRDSDWVRSPIDAFVKYELEASGVSPAPASDRDALIRRIYLDLVGIPPTAGQVQAFIADNSPNAVSSLVDQLIASPEYGERWGRHWLDVARYADSNGLDENLAFGNAWRYRDYVIDAFNNDKPFDRFVMEQIAGDLIPDANRGTRTATGFLVLGAKVLAEPDREKLTMDTIDEQLDTTGKAFMGMTFGCVRCHDHKFDPIKQSDYYALAAIFKSTKTFGDTNTGAIKHWHEHVFATEGELESLKTVDAEIAKLKNEATAFKNDAMAKLRERARSQATAYLSACTQFEVDDSLRRISQVAEKYGIHPRTLHHCRRHLEFHSDDPVFQPWHELRLAADPAGAVSDFYEVLFEEAEAKSEKKVNESKTPLLESQANDKHLTAEPSRDIGGPKRPSIESLRSALRDPSGFLAVPPKPEFAFDSQTLKEYDQLMERARVYESRAGDVPSAMGVSDGATMSTLPIHIRGSHLNLGAPVTREFPEVMRSSSIRPIFPSHQSGRLELAQWMTNTRHPLTARVYVNRVWRWHFGEGLVRTTENFGVLGDQPSHPDLLDWLARRFMASGWSTKELHRLILSSSVYQMSSSHPDPALGMEIDPENRLWWRFPMQRMGPEQLRDSILAISGRLDRSMAGKTVPLRNRQFVFNHTSVDHTKYDSLRRAVYLPVIRNNLYTLFEQFDFPDPTMPTGDRNATVVAPQALLLMNDPLVMDSAAHFARTLRRLSLSDTSRIELAYKQALGRAPSQVESRRAMEFIDGLVEGEMLNSERVDEQAVGKAWSLFCQSLFVSNEFLYVR